MSQQDSDIDTTVTDQSIVNAARQRLVDGRWTIVAAAAVLVIAVLTQGLPIAFAIVGFAVVVLATVAMARQRTGARLAARASRSRGIWPDTGMKVVVETLPQAGFLVDRRGIVRYVNKEAQQMFGPARPGDPLSFRLRMPSFLEALDRVSAGEEAERIQWSEKVPTERWLEAFVAPVAAPRDDLGSPARPAFLLIVVSDLTEQHRLERMRADFVANASHELRTPLASLSGFIETLQGPAREDADARDKFLAIMNEQAARMSRLIGDLLSLSRIEMRAHVRPGKVVDLANVVRHCADAMGPLARELDVVIENTLPETGLAVLGDHDELVQVFENLIENAIKYGSEGGRILLSGNLENVDAAQPEIAISVRDWGPGISAEHLPRLTERFYRIDVASSREKQGTGLGLAIVKHILNRHRARLSVDNAVDRGAMFTVRIAAYSEDDEDLKKDN